MKGVRNRQEFAQRGHNKSKFQNYQADDDDNDEDESCNSRKDTPTPAVQLAASEEDDENSQNLYRNDKVVF